MKTLVFALMAAVAASCQSVVAEPVADDEFIFSLRAGFDRDYCGDSVAKEFGGGTCSILLSGKKPEVTFCDFEKGKAPARLTPEQAIKKADKTTSVQKKQATWFAWRNEKGVFNIAFNATGGEYEKSVINLIADDPDVPGELTEWSAWDIYHISSTSGANWIRAEKANFLWIRMGCSAGDASAKLKQLVDLGVITDVRSRQ